MYPRLAMSRSIGDFITTSVGVIPNPEIIEYNINKSSKYMIIVSDGIWQFMTNEKVMSNCKPIFSFWRSLVNKDNTKINRSTTKKSSILRDKNKKEEELNDEKTLEVVQEVEENKEEIENHEEIEEKKVEMPFQPSNDNKMKSLPTEEYIKITVQSVLEQGLLSIAMLHSANTIKFLGNYLNEKSKTESPNL